MQTRPLKITSSDRLPNMSHFFLSKSKSCYSCYSNLCFLVEGPLNTGLLTKVTLENSATVKNSSNSKNSMAQKGTMDMNIRMTTAIELNCKKFESFRSMPLYFGDVYFLLYSWFVVQP